MLDVVTTSFYIKSAAFEKDEFSRYSNDLFDEWDRYVDIHLDLPDYAVTLVVEEGSIKGAAKIAATAGALYIAIGNYGDFISGVKTIGEQASYVTNALFDQAKQQFGCKSARGNSKQSGGEIFYLKSLFERVQRGQATPDEAVAEIQSRWGHEVGSSPEFLRDLSESLVKAPRHPEQLAMPDEFWEPCSDSGEPGRAPKRKFPRIPETPILQHYRIEIFRPKKGGSKKIRLTKLK